MENTYGQFCTVARGAEVLCERWTPLVVRELLCGSKRFNDLRRGVPRMSPALLSQRLKDLEAAGVIARVASASNPATSIRPSHSDQFSHHREIPSPLSSVRSGNVP